MPDINEMIDDVPIDTILSRTYFEKDGYKAILFGFAPGQELSEHSASVPAFVHFLEGAAHLVLGDEERKADPDTWVY